MTKPTTNLTREDIRAAIYKFDLSRASSSLAAIAGEMTQDQVDAAYDDDINRLLQLIDTYIKTKVDENSKAYGGCLDCYGKGYATQESATIGYPDFVGDKGFKHHEHKMIFCECPRGSQLRIEIALLAEKETL